MQDQIKAHGEGNRGMKLTPIGRDVAGKFAKLGPVARARVSGRMLKLGERVQDRLEDSTSTWDHKPEFTIKQTNDGVEISTDSKIFPMVDQGTPPHVIEPKSANVLAFQSGYAAKSQPRVAAASPGGASGPMVYTDHVDHPGTQGRHFTETIFREMQAILPDEIQEALAESIAEVGL